jgi:hypothetical protein
MTWNSFRMTICASTLLALMTGHAMADLHIDGSREQLRVQANDAAIESILTELHVCLS